MKYESIAEDFCSLMRSLCHFFAKAEDTEMGPG